jgi:hypothetical protein
VKLEGSRKKKHENIKDEKTKKGKAKENKNKNSRNPHPIFITTQVVRLFHNPQFSCFLSLQILSQFPLVSRVSKAFGTILKHVDLRPRARMGSVGRKSELTHLVGSS